MVDAVNSAPTDESRERDRDRDRADAELKRQLAAERRMLWLFGAASVHGLGVVVLMIAGRGFERYFMWNDGGFNEAVGLAGIYFCYTLGTCLLAQWLALSLFLRAPESLICLAGVVSMTLAAIATTMVVSTDFPAKPLAFLPAMLLFICVPAIVARLLGARATVPSRLQSRVGVMFLLQLMLAAGIALTAFRTLPREEMEGSAGWGLLLYFGGPCLVAGCAVLLVYYGFAVVGWRRVLVLTAAAPLSAAAGGWSVLALATSGFRESEFISEPRGQALVACAAATCAAAILLAPLLMALTMRVVFKEARPARQKSVV